MQEIKLIRDSDGSYVTGELNGASFDKFVILLLEDIQPCITDAFKLFVSDPSEDFMLNNGTFMEKDRQGKVLISDANGERKNFPDPDDDAFETTVENIAEVMNKFEAFVEFEPDEIFLRYENGVVSIFGKDEL